MSNTTPIAPEARLYLGQSIPVILTPVFKATGKPIPGATVSNVTWTEDNPIGDFSPTSDPNTFLFTPSMVGTMIFSANAIVTVN